ncbi:hypothetical protein [Streptomyces albipurpureus]|uniref:Uncharacterized protein n=1 Tax=Streptomyces albipurpureus TaxID=2897419 RepID=A0ABT0USX3_9ACTN|nr:hypothetical protein [Streptomyces sp. CWNU-1]MCM2391702.1 hypothetical protein [Streptomyces sp. CWNU-1]
MASLTASYLETLYRESEADDAHPIDLDFDAVTGRALRDVDPEEVYRRPFKEVWNALSKGESLDVATTRGAHRLDTITATDLQLARTHTVREVAADQDGVTYTVRELFGEYDCALCMIASTQRYHKRDLQPIHPGCNCIVKTVSADYDPGQIIDEAKLERIHELVQEATGQSDRGGRAIDYRQIIIARKHGEIGPVLTFQDHSFIGPGAIGPTGNGGDEPPSTTPAQPNPPEDGPGPLGSSIFDGGANDHDETPPTVRTRQALDHAIAAIARVHGMDRELPRIPLYTETRPDYGGVYRRVGDESVLLRINPAPYAHPELTAVHELGHFLDHQGIGEPGVMSTGLDNDEVAPDSIFAEWWDAVQRTDTHRTLRMMKKWSPKMRWAKIEQPNGTIEDFYVSREYVSYLARPREVFGRAYAQWIATRSYDPVLMEQLHELSDPGMGAKLITGFTAGYPGQWPAEEFAEIADALDELFEQLGLLGKL